MPHRATPAFQPPFILGLPPFTWGPEGRDEMPGVSRIGAALASTLLLLAPAIWNRFPLLEYDTGGYLARWFEPWLVPSRSTVYGLFLVLLAHPDFWPVVIVQSLLTVWVLSLVLRATGLGGRPLLLVGVTAALAVLTTLPWIAGILLTDIFAGLAVLAVHLLAFAEETLRRWERHALFALLAFSVATHSATFAVVLGLVVGAALIWTALRIGSPFGIARGAAALGLGALMLLSANFATSGRFVWTPGGMALSFGRMLQDGVVQRYLAEHCPDRHLQLCAYRTQLPGDADQFFWSGGDTIFNKLGRFDGLGDEMGTIVADSLRAYPAWQARLAVLAAARQFMHIGSGEGVVNSAWHTHWAIGAFMPSTADDMHAARQQQGELSFAAINLVHRPVALLSILLLLPLAFAGWRREPLADLAALATTITLALAGNAVVCGVFANPHDRYGARLVWLAPLAVSLALCRLYAERDRLRLGALALKPAPPG
jgi:hypothetical protein